MTLSMLVTARADQARRELAATGEALRGVGAAGESAASGGRTATMAMRGLTLAAAAAGAAVGAALSSRALASAADQWSDMSSRIGAAVKDMEAAPALMQDMLRLANASYSSLGQTVSMFSSNITSMRDLGFSTQQTVDFTESLNHMLVITATKGEQAASVQNALSKAMATGRMDADGLETVLAHGGRAAEALAAELDTNVSNLRNLASQGRITGDVIARALLGALEDVRREAGEMPTTIGDGFLKIGNGVVALIGTIDKSFGFSEAIARRLDSLSGHIAALAAADFAGLMDRMASGAETFGQALLVLAATRLPALLGPVSAVSLSTVIMNAQFIAGAVASRAMTVALAAQAVAARRLAAALAMVGGPFGLAVAGMAALGVGMVNGRGRAAEVAASLGEFREAQDAVNAAIETFYRERTPEALRAMVALAEASEAAAQSTLAAAQNELSSSWSPLDTQIKPGFAGRFFGLQLWDTENLAEGREHLSEAERQADAAGRALERARTIATGYVGALGEAAAEAGQLTNAQLKAEAAARAQIQQLQGQAQVNALIARYGEQSLSVTIARHAAERRAFAAQVESRDVSRELKDEMLAAWDAAQRFASVDTASGIYRAVGAVDSLVAKLAGALGVWRQLAGEVGRIGFDTIGVQAETAALKAGKSEGEARMLGGLASERAKMEASGKPAWLTNAYMFGREMAERAQLSATEERDAQLALRRPKVGGVGDGGTRGKGGASGRSEYDESREALKSLLEEQRNQLAILRETDPVQQEILRNHKAMAVATVAEAEEVRGLIAERRQLEQIRTLTEDIGRTGEQAFTGWVKGAHSLRDALSMVVDKLLEMSASSLWDTIWNGPGTGGGSGLGSLVTGLIGGLLGGLPARAEGGDIRGPGGPREDKVLLWGSNGEYVVNAAATAANRGLIEAINAGARPEQLLGLMLGERAPRLADGGLIGSSAPAGMRAARGPAQAAAAPRAPSRTVFEINVSGTGTAEIRQGVLAAIDSAFDSFTRNVLPTEVMTVVNDRWSV